MGDLYREGRNTEPTIELLTKVRAEVYEERPRVLIDAWRQAIENEEQALDGERRIKDIPDAEDRVKAWQIKKPKVVAWEERAAELPVSESGIVQHLEKCEDWASRWDIFRKDRYVEISRRIDQEQSHAVEMIEEALEMVPVSLRADSLLKYVSQLKHESNQEWDVIRLRKEFEQFSPGRIRAEVEQLDADLQSVSFQAAKLEWQKRVAEDSDLQDAMRDLRTHYQRNRGEVKANGFALFERVLRSQPVWITTALSGQSIPLQSGIFDLLVIDEATQCTLTNLLPLLYRAKRLVVIGDPEQLPAIASIGLGAERSLSEKYQVTEWLTMLGHAGNDIYKSRVASLPRRQADVITLYEHYRSHPLITAILNSKINVS